MLPSSSRIKLNRIVLKDIVGIKMLPRRKREGRTLGDMTTEPIEQEKRQQVSEEVPEKDTDFACNLPEPARTEVTATDFASMGANKCQRRTQRKKKSYSTKNCKVNQERHNTEAYIINTPPRDAAIEGSLRQAVTPIGCNLCGDCKNLTPQKKTPSRKEQSNMQLKTNEGQSDTDASKIAVWLTKYPTVKLCDVAQKCDVCPHNCGYKLPYALKNKRVHCFKRDMRAGSRFRPSCVRPNKQDRNENMLDTSVKLYPKFKAKKSTCQWKRLTYNQRQLKKNISFSRSAFDFLNSQKSEVSATCFTSLSLSSIKGEHSTSFLVRDVEKNIGPQSDCIGVATQTFSDLQDENCKDVLKSSAFEKVDSGLSCNFETCQESSGCSRADTPDYPCGQTCKSEESEPTEVHPQKSEVEANEQDSFTCQRVRIYCGKVNKNISCARTCMPWPFLNTRCALTAQADTTICQTGATHLSAENNCDFSLNRKQICSSRKNHVDNLSNEPRDYLSNAICHTCQNEGNEPAVGDLAVVPTKRERCGTDTSVFWNENNFSHSTAFEIASVPGLTSSTSIEGPEIDSSMSTPSPAVLGLSDWETAKPESPLSSHLIRNSFSATALPVPPSQVSIKTKSTDAHSTSPSSGHTSPKYFGTSAEKHLLDSKETQPACSSHTSSPVLPRSPDSLQSCESLYLLPQECNKEVPPQLEPDNISNPGSLSQNGTEELLTHSTMTELLLSPILSPVRSPQGCMSPSKKNGSINHQTSPGHDITLVGEDNQNRRPCLDNNQGVRRGSEEMDGVSSKSTSVLFHNSVDVSDDQNELEKSEKFPSRVWSETPSSASSNVRSSPTEMQKTGKEEVAGTDCAILDEFSAYERDILLVDVIQDDPELFESLPEKGLLKLGPARAWTAPNRSPVRRHNTSTDTDQRFKRVIMNFQSDHNDVPEEDNNRPWRPQGCRNPTAVQIKPGPASDKQIRHKDHLDVNNNHLNADLRSKGSQCIETLGSRQKAPPRMSLRNSEETMISNQTHISNVRPQKSHTYCRHYFSESLSCGFKVCRFKHVPVAGDEKFCIDRVTQFVKNPTCLQKAGAVFMGYYLNNPPGLYFSMSVFLSLLWSLLKANMVSDVLSLLNVGLSHKIAPGHEFLLALYNFVREKGLVGCVPELIQLTLKMAREGLVLNLDWLACVQNTPEFQKTVSRDSTASLSANQVAPFPEYLSLAHAVVEIELCAKQEDWKRMGKVFRSICQSSHHPNNMEQLCGRIAIALLSESKDKLSLPFATFAEAVFQSEVDNKVALIQSFFGRIGVSLMLRYHKMHQWAKGQKVVEALSLSKISYSTLKGLFGNEDGVSRCSLVTKATELFLLSGSVEGALNTLRENNWFQSSHLWPCEPADLTSRSHVLMRLAEKTSHRDTLEVLSNLPGIKEPNDLIDICSYAPVFERHLQVCVDRQVLTVASDTADFMFSNHLAVNQTVLHMLLHKLGKQNLWLRAREVFRHALSVGYYPGVSAPSGFMTLIVPSHLWEVELALTFEMFITVNATVILQLLDNTTSSLSITLKRFHKKFWSNK